jgi:cytochrome P450 family 724 subfamily B polypeptide 1
LVFYSSVHLLEDAMVMAVLLLVALVALVAAVFRHFLPLLLNPGAPRGSFGWPLVGETLGFLRPHASDTTGAFLHDHISRFAYRIYANNKLITDVLAI